MNAVQVYQHKITREEVPSWYDLEGFFPELRIETETPLERLKLRTHHYENFDGERGWNLASIALDDIPFMIIQKAGRGGRDHEARFITDAGVYRQAILYLIQTSAPPDSEVINPEEDRPELTAFYGHSLNEFFNPNITPQYKVGDVVEAMVLENHCNYSSKKIPTRVQIKEVSPTHPTKTYYGLQLDRCWEGTQIVTKQGNGTIYAQFNDADVMQIIQ